MPWSFERKVIYPAGWCKGPVEFGKQMSLEERVWQAYQTVDKKLHVRRAKADLSGWEWDTELPMVDWQGVEHNGAEYPDATFDKAGQPIAIFEKLENGISDVWVRRITEINGVRCVVISKLTENARRPMIYRDGDEDVLAFYVKSDGTIGYKVQSEGWVTERLAGNAADVKTILNIERTADNAIALMYASLGNELKYVKSSCYPMTICNIEHISCGAISDVLQFASVINAAYDGRMDVNAVVNMLELAGLSYLFSFSQTVDVAAVANVLELVGPMAVAVFSVVQPSAAVNTLRVVPVEPHPQSQTIDIQSVANLLSLQPV